MIGNDMFADKQLNSLRTHPKKVAQEYVEGYFGAVLAA